MAIPNNIIVGVVDRDDTYTGKLGFVTYPKNKKGDLQHTGVRGWMARNKSNHPLLHFENVPTEGFVLNKKVGGRKPHYGEYKGRTVKARVYDPRGFEFEIDMENICHILEHNGSTPGKALDGEFVYGWLGSGGVFLVSCKSEIYKNQTTNKTTSKETYLTDFLIGKNYETSKGTKVKYIGESDRFEKNHSSIDSINKKTKVFINLDYFSRVPKLCYPKDIVKEYNGNINEKEYDLTKIGSGENYNNVILSLYADIKLKKIDLSYIDADLSKTHPKHSMINSFGNNTKLLIGSVKDLGLKNNDMLLVSTNIKDVYMVATVSLNNSKTTHQPKLEYTLSRLNEDKIFRIYTYKDFIKLRRTDNGYFVSSSITKKDIEIKGEIYKISIEEK